MTEPADLAEPADDTFDRDVLIISPMFGADRHDFTPALSLRPRVRVIRSFAQPLGLVPGSFPYKYLVNRFPRTPNFNHFAADAVAQGRCGGGDDHDGSRGVFCHTRWRSKYNTGAQICQVGFLALLALAASADTAEEMTEEQIADAREQALAALEKPLEKMKIKVDHAYYLLADHAALHMWRLSYS